MGIAGVRHLDNTSLTKNINHPKTKIEFESTVLQHWIRKVKKEKKLRKTVQRMIVGMQVDIMDLRIIVAIVQ